MTVPPGLVEQPAGYGGTTLYWWPLTGRVSLLLTPAERHRAARLPATAGARFAEARDGVRTVLADLLGADPRRVLLSRTRCSGCGRRGHGPPRAATPEGPVNLRLSLSHTGRVAVLAVSADYQVGIDIETDRIPGAALTRLTSLATEEAHTQPVDRLRAWTRKEAVAKGMGLGLAADLRRIAVHPGTEGPVTVHVPEGGWPTVWRVDDVRCPIRGPSVTGALATGITS